MSKGVLTADLRRALGRRPRLPLGNLPTPLEPAPRLSSAVGGTTIYVKRDDLTGLALGGNKVRQLEYLLGEAIHLGATSIITGAGVDSNHCRQLAAACAKLGLRACLVLRGERPVRMEGNLLLDTLFGAECRFIPTERFYDEFEQVANGWADELAKDGERPYVINTLGFDTHSVALAALGYAQAALELEEQFELLGWRPDVAYFCSGAATQAGAWQLHRPSLAAAGHGYLRPRPALSRSPVPSRSRSASAGRGLKVPGRPRADGRARWR